MKKNAAKVTLALVVALVMIVGVVSPVAAKPVRTFQIDSQELVDYATPYRLRAEASFEGYGVWGYKYMWRKDMGGGNFQTFTGSTGGPYFFSAGRITSGSIVVLGPGGQTPGTYQFTLWLVGKNGRPVRRIGYAQSTATLSAPIMFAEDFTGVSSGSLPAGWTTNNSSKVYVNPGAWAGGTSPELYLDYGEPENITYDYWACTPAIDATGATSALNLTFKHNLWVYNWTRNFTYSVEVSSNNGTTWTAVLEETPTETQYPGMEIGPETVNIDLGAYAGDIILLRWRLREYTYYSDGWRIDDIYVEGS